MRFLKQFLASAVLLGLAATAHAVPVTWSDSIDFNPGRYIQPGSPASYTHSILDEGYTPHVDSIDYYQLRFHLYDDANDPWYSPIEMAAVNLAGTSEYTVYFDLSGGEFGGWSLAGQAILELAGQLTVIVSSITGDFFIGSSTLSVWGEERGGQPGSGYPVPEPGSLGLLGLGLLAVGLVSRKRKA